MTFLDQYTPAKYSLRALHIRKHGDEVTATFDLMLHNSNDRVLQKSSLAVVLTAGETDTLLGFINEHLTEFEIDTGLTRIS